MKFKLRRFTASLLLLVYLVAVLPPLPVYASTTDLGTFKKDHADVKFTPANGSFEIKFAAPGAGVEDTNGDEKNKFANTVAATLSKEGLTNGDDAYIQEIADSVSGVTVGASDPSLDLKSLTRVMSVLLYQRMFPALDFESNSSYEQCVSYALNYEVTKDLKGAVCSFMGGAYINTFLSKRGYADDNCTVYLNTGESDPTYVSGTDIDKKMYFATEYAIIAGLEAYMYYPDTWAKDTLQQQDWQSDEDVKETLKWLQGFKDLYAPYFPFLDDVWTHEIDPNVKIEIEGVEEDSTLENMCKATGADAEALNVDAQDYEIDTRNYQENYDQTTPVGDFYIINSSHGIVSYKRDDVLSAIEVNETLDETLQEKLEKQKRESTTILDDRLYQEENINTQEAEKSLVEFFNEDKDDTAQDDNSTNTNANATGTEEGSEEESEDNTILHKATVASGLKDKKTYDVDENGLATSTAAVTMSDYIVTGMSYSTTYVPLRTNLYSPEVIASYDKDFRENFYYKYGFMRKALFIDNSATSAVDYYNANGKYTGTRSICTLRNLIESNGKDITLYIDPNFYNAKEAIETGNSTLESRNVKMRELSEELDAYVTVWEASPNAITDIADIISTSAKNLSRIMKSALMGQTEELDMEFYVTTKAEMRDTLMDVYDFDVNRFKDSDDLSEYIRNLDAAITMSDSVQVDNAFLKTGEYSNYSNKIRSDLASCDESGYFNLNDNDHLDKDSIDSVVLSSKDIQHYLSMTTTYKEEHLDESGEVLTTNVYTSSDTYTPMVGLAYTSILYRNSDLYTLANAVCSDNPVFIASDDLCGIKEANQWYRNTLLNYLLVQNLKSAAQVDYQYVSDLDCPVYMDVFGNIVTQSGTVVIPASCNATLHDGNFKNYNVATGTYVNYSKDYSVPLTCQGAYSVLAPFFIADLNSGVYTINNLNIKLAGGEVNLGNVSQYDIKTQKAVMTMYKNSVVEKQCTNLNWMAMVNICNEVMRGATIDNIDMDAEGINVFLDSNKAGIVAASKLESLINSLKGIVSNTLIKIPDFSHMDNMVFFVAFFIKIMIVATTAIVIFYVYRDGVSNALGIRTLWKSLSAVALTFSCIVIVPAVFQLTYYTANKFLLQNESMRILMLNTDKRECGVEIGVTETYTVEDNNEFSIQLDWLTVPWYEELEDVLYKNSYENLKKTKLKAYQQSPIYDNTDVTLYDDGVYVTTNDLFDSVSIDYTFNTASDIRGLYMYSNGSEQTAGFYSPYYAFLRILLANVNEYNARGEGTYNYTTKYVSGNRLKTVGLCYNYFNSTYFMGETLNKAATENDADDDTNTTSEQAVELDLLKEATKDGQEDIMHIYQIYMPTELDRENGIYPAKKWLEAKENSLNRALLFDDATRTTMAQCLWFNDLEMDDMQKRAEIMDNYAREFVVRNRDFMTKVTDETFIKVMALSMAIKYNQLFGIKSANALEIYNMDSNDILRLSLVNHSEAVLASPMSFSRFVYNFGGEASVYAAAVLEMIMWVGSFIKPICTVIVFISVFLSIWVFRVVLRRPSHNLWGYLVTILLLSATNFAHAVLIKASMKLPQIGLPTFGCVLFVIFAQVAYLLFLGYVTGIALKDWYNLGATEYANTARKVSSKFSRKDDSSDLSGSVKHHSDNWDYYNDLVAQHRSRNA